MINNYFEFLISEKTNKKQNVGLLKKLNTQNFGGYVIDSIDNYINYFIGFKLNEKNLVFINLNNILNFEKSKIYFLEKFESNSNELLDNYNGFYMYCSNKKKCIDFYEFIIENNPRIGDFKQNVVYRENYFKELESISKYQISSFYLDRLIDNKSNLKIEIEVTILKKF